MLHLQANGADDPALREQLMEASRRISAVGRAYDRLAYAADYENIDLVVYLREVIEDLGTTIAPCEIQLDVPEEIQIAADRAILVGLIINELVSNAGKYAYPDGPGGAIRVRLVLVEKNAVLISISDEGIGLPRDFNPAISKRLGTRLVTAMAKQLGAELVRPTSTKGTQYALHVPLQAAPNNRDH